jgi:LysR family transcriptional regulator, regulator for genes of the gallate degradation pathway
MDLRFVRYFLAVCEHGSFTAAGKVCGANGASVGAGVRDLERMVGGRLWERRGGRLTAFGAALHPLLEDLQSAADHIAGALMQQGIPVRATRASRSLLGRGKPAPPT